MSLAQKRREMSAVRPQITLRQLPQVDKRTASAWTTVRGYLLLE